jgi:CheY-like chemotaxis protein
LKTAPFRKAVLEVTEKDQATILLVDDEDFILDVNREILDTMGYRVLTALTGREALEIYRAQGGEIDLVILDMVMPGIAGGEIFDTIKTLNPGVKVICSSGYVLNDETAKLLERGCDAFIQKPFRIDDFLAKIREVISSRWKRHRAPRLSLNAIPRWFHRDGRLSRIGVAVFLGFIPEKLTINLHGIHDGRPAGIPVHLIDDFGDLFPGRTGPEGCREK